jgi:hypothetical protein
MMKQLESFIGNWKTTGTVYNEDGTITLFEGSDIYEWLPNSQFVLHKVDVMMGGEQNLTTEILGVDRDGTFFIHAYEMNGGFSKMTATAKDGEWLFTNEEMRFTGRFSNEGNILTGTWEKKAIDDTWQKWMDVTLKK